MSIVEDGPIPARSDVSAAQAASLPAPQDAAELSRRRRSGHGTSFRAQLANLPLFGELSPASLHELILRSRIVVLEAGKALFHQGDASNTLYVVVDGAVTPIAEGGARRKLAVIEQGDFVGEIGLVTRQPRNATVAALVDSKLLAIDRRVLFPLMRSERKLARAVLRPLRERMLDRQLRTNLFFAAFGQDERGAIARQFRLLEVKDGTRVVTQGEPPEGLFVVLAGTFSRLDRTSGLVVGRIEIGDLFGGSELLSGQPADCDVVAHGRAWLIVLGERRFRRIVDANPRLVRVVKRLAGGERECAPDAAGAGGAVGGSGAGDAAKGRTGGAAVAVSPPASPPSPASGARPAPPPSARKGASRGRPSRPSASTRAAAGGKARRSRS